MARRRDHRDYGHGVIDGYEELQTWLALLTTMIEPRVATTDGRAPPAGADPDGAATLHALPGPSTVHFPQKGCCWTPEQRRRQREGQRGHRESPRRERLRVQLGELASEYQYQQLVPLVPLDASRPASAVNVAATSVLAADPTDHPILWGECTGICDGEGGDYRWPTPPASECCLWWKSRGASAPHRALSPSGWAAGLRMRVCAVGSEGVVYPRRQASTSPEIRYLRGCLHTSTS